MGFESAIRSESSLKEKPWTHDSEDYTSRRRVTTTSKTTNGEVMSVTLRRSTRFVVMRKTTRLPPTVVRLETTFTTSPSRSSLTSHSRSLPAAATSSYTARPLEMLKNRGNRTLENWLNYA